MKSEPVRSAAYDDGFYAYAQGKPTDCPYAFASTFSRNQWHLGWTDAESADAIKIKPPSKKWKGGK